MDSGRNFLEADNSIMERNLRFVKNPLEENFNQYFGRSSNPNDSSNAAVTVPPRDYIVVQPKPGLCVKSVKVNTDEKYFINVCQAEEIPSPEDISETELSDILDSDKPDSFRVPMSISEPRTTQDRSNKPVDAVDIAISPSFFIKIEKSIVFREFFLALISEALSFKYNIQINKDKSIILKNRKFIGNLLSHRICNKDVKTVLNTYRNPSKEDLEKLESLDKFSKSSKAMVQEINDNEVNNLKQKSKEIKSQQSCNRAHIKQDIAQAGSTIPEYKIRGRIKYNTVVEIQAEFYMPKCTSSKELTLDIGEDRIIVESMKRGYLFDKFFNYRFNQEKAHSLFNLNNKMLFLRIPLIPNFNQNIETTS